MDMFLPLLSTQSHLPPPPSSTWSLMSQVIAQAATIMLMLMPRAAADQGVAEVGGRGVRWRLTTGTHTCNRIPHTPAPRIQWATIFIINVDDAAHAAALPSPSPSTSTSTSARAWPTLCPLCVARRHHRPSPTSHPRQPSPPAPLVAITCAGGGGGADPVVSLTTDFCLKCNSDMAQCESPRIKRKKKNNYSDCETAQCLHLISQKLPLIICQKEASNPGKLLKVPRQCFDVFREH